MRFALVFAVGIVFLNVQKSNAQVWENPEACYTNSNCSDFDDRSKPMTYMGCSINVTYRTRNCPNIPTTEIFIVSISFNLSSDPNCATLYNYLHPGGNFDADRYKDVLADVYLELMSANFNAKANKPICGQDPPIRYTYWWEGNCTMACQIELESGEFVYSSKSCQDEACCGKSYEFCLNGDTGLTEYTEHIHWIGSACPAQTIPDFSKCPSVGDLYDGIRVVDVDASYCTSSCEEE